MRQQDRKTANWKALAEEFYNMTKDTTPDTAVRVEVFTNTKGKADGIDIYPAETNRCNAFFFVEEFTDFIRCKGLSGYVSVVDGICVARIH